jgi:type III restriction enzyme
VERISAEALDANEDARLFVKLPRWFKVETPLGAYRPDWVIVRERDGKVSLVVETRGTTDRTTLPDAELLRLKCGERHFEGFLNMPCEQATTMTDLD